MACRRSARLADFHEDLALVGGLNPRHLCRPSTSYRTPSTLIVDFAIPLAARGGGERVDGIEPWCPFQFWNGIEFHR